MACTMSACALLIPENPSTPRYNDVLGGPRAPKLNPASAGRSSMAPAPVRQQQASLHAPTVAAAPVPVQEIVSVDTSPPTGANTPTGLIAEVPASVRAVPAGNQDPIQMAAGYPDLHSIPPTPTVGAGGDAERLARVRAQLEAERNGADAERQRLSTDAAAEPSLLGTPLPEPVRPAAPAPQSAAPAVGAIAQLPPPPPPIGQSAGTPWDRSAPMEVTSAPQVAAVPGPGLEPIVLRAPTGIETPIYGNGAMGEPPPSGFAQLPPTDAITLRPPVSVAGGAYLPDSRYAARRNN